MSKLTACESCGTAVEDRDAMDSLTAVDELRGIQWHIIALGDHFSVPGTSEGAMLKEATYGLEKRIAWVIKKLNGKPWRVE